MIYILKNKVIDAYVLAKQLHDGQKRKFRNVDYFVHPKTVARKLEDLTNDEDLIICGLLHDTIEDCDITKETIEKLFGSKVANIVNELTNDNKKIKLVGKTMYLSEKMLQLSSDALTVKLVDRLDNVMYMDKDCKTRDQLNFVKKYYSETSAILKALEAHINLTQLHNKIIRRISSELEFIQEKYKW